MSARKFPESSAEAVQAWLVRAVADRTGLDPLRVEIERPIAEFGLGSRDLVALAVGLSEQVGRELDPSLLYDHPTISSVAAALSGAGPVRTPSASPVSGASPADDIAIISMACRFPGGADDPEGLWRLLAAGEDVIGEVPAGRWNTQALYDPDPEATGKAYTLRGGFLTAIDRFDASFFGIAPREAAAMDPQQRLLLQTGWEAIERAGMVPRALSGSSTGVYLGLYESGYLASAGLGRLDGHVGTGAAASVASGRLAYTLDLRGPAVTVDTACSSSLVALHLAARALAGGECDLALAGGVTLMVTPRGHVEFSRLRGLSPTGRCRPFSNDADGVVWAEGCGLVLLKRLADARRDGDRVLAVVKGSAINQDGRSQGLSAPSGPAQERVVRAALAAAGLEPHDVDHVEAHGTGTRLGDPIEGRALASVFGPGRPGDRPLGVGSVKSNIGHAQAAAGIAGLIKMVLALRHELLPASLYAEHPTEQIDWAGGGLEVPGRARAWPRGERVRRAGVSAFGISGTNAHVVIEEAPEDLTPTAPVSSAPVSSAAAPSRQEDTGYGRPEVTLFPLSARGLPALRGQAGRLLDALTAAEPGPPLSAVAATLAHHRTHFEQRAVVVARHRDELLSGLRGLASGQADENLVVEAPETLPPGKLAFVFPGQGAQWAGMARDLLARSAVFADELDRCDAALRPYTDWSVTAVLRGDAQAPPLERVDVVQPVLFAVMVSLAAVWRARGVRPDAVVGHSQGEVAAACVAGGLSLHDAAAVVALRSRTLTDVVGTGAMAVVALPHEEVEARIAELGGEVSVAAVNSGRSTVVAGDVAPLESLLADLEREQVFTRRLGVDYASHSAQVEPVREAILSELDGIVTYPASVAWYSTVFGGPVGEELEADYWYRNLREPVRFAATVERMVADGYRCFVELSPHPSLITALRTVAEDTAGDLVAVGSLRRDEDGPTCLDRAAAELHVHGREIDWSRLVADGAWAELPTYAWDPQRYWTEPDSSAGAWGLLPRAGHPLLGVQLQSPDASRWTFRGEWSRATAEWLPDHVVFGQVVVSGTTLAELCRAALAVARPDGPADVADLLLLAPLTLPASGTVEVSVEVVAADPRAVPEVFVHSRPRGPESGASGWTLHATASAGEPATGAFGPPPVWPEATEPCWAPDTYGRLAEAGLTYGPAFQCVRSAVRTGDGELLARLSLPSHARDVADPYPVHPALLDAALQVAAAFDTSGRVLLPVAVDRCELPPGEAADLIASVRRTGGAGADVTLDVVLWDTDGLPVGRLEGVRLRAADPAELRGAADSARHLYEVAWTAVATEAEPGVAPSPGDGWTLLGDPSDEHLAAALSSLDPAGTGLRTADTVDAVPDGTDTLIRLWPASGTEAEPATRAEELATAGLAELRALLALPRDRAPSRVVWVTRGAVAADGGDTVRGLAQSALWGLARSARAEHPELGLRLIDLDGPGPWPALPAAVAEPDEPELALRDGRLLAPRLVRARVGDATPLDDRSDLELCGAATVVPTDGTVLVTGGLGAVGGHIARWLARSGVPRLVLTSRRGPDDPRRAEVTAELSALGAEVDVVACDVADEAALAKVLDRVGRAGAGRAGGGRELPLRGVVHCAGLLADGVLAEQTPERFAEVLRPKVAGAVNLHRLTADTPLDLFLLVSSAAGVVGNAGQSNYAAANVFLDQLAYHRRALAMPGLSVSFGAWSGAGLAAEHADLERMAQAGYRALTPDQACELVELSLSHSGPHLVAWALDRSRLRDTFARDGGPAALWRTLLPAPQATRGGAALADRLTRLPEAERAERVRSLIREEAARVLGLRSPDAIRPDQPLRELGMDSLMAVELRNRIGARLGSRLAATVLFDHPTTARLADHLLNTVLASADRAAKRPASGAPSPHGGSDEPIAVVSMACRLPGGVAGPEALWELLAEGRDAVGPFPADRWDVASLYDPDPEAPGKTYAREGGFLRDIDAFDAGFFEITPREAAAMDPQQRLLLETAWEALERAGMVPAELAGSTTGVYIGMFGSDYLAGSRLDQLDGHVGTGTALSVASGRLAYALGLHGPALTVDTACSSSLAAVHLAAQALRSGECDLALTGGVTLMVTPQTFVEFSRLRGLSPTGRCRSFSDDADGAVWAEGAGMVVLKRLGDARRDGDEVLAVLRGTAVNQDGRSQGLSAPNGPAQERVVRRALELSGLAPADIDYVEAHGTGTTLGDPIEAGALSEVFGASRPQGRPLYVGSLKSNLGHLQAASGIAGLIKVVLALRHQTLPRTLHATRPTRHVDWDSSGLRLLREPVAWPAGARMRRAGVSAFGISGTNAHVVVEEAPHQAPIPSVQGAPERRLFVVSARGDAALRGQAARLAEHLAALPADSLASALPDIAHTLARHRSHFERRAAVPAGDRGELLAGLDAVARGDTQADVCLSPPGAAPTGKLAFVFPGHGGQWPGMGVELMADSEAFREELSRCDEAIARHTGWSVLAVLRGEEGAPDLAGTDVLQPVLFAVNAALAAAWRSLGVVPDAVVGHSLGEIAAAYGAGALTLDAAAAVVARRARAVVPLAGAGGLLSVERSREEVERFLAPYPDRLFVAAVNSGTSTAVSGDLDALAELRRRLDEEGVPARRLSSAFASHSPLMAPLRGELLDALDGVRGTRARTPLYSTVLAEPIAGDRLDADYWYANLRQPVRFADTVRRMLDDGYRHFVELSPHPSLGPAIESVAAEAGVEAVSVGSLRRDDGGRDGLLRQLGRLYGAGHTPDWSALFPAGRRADLPTYAFARERHWLSAAPAPASGPGTSPLVGTHLEASDEPDRHLFQTDIDLRDGRFGYLSDHRVAGEVWLPAAAFLEMALAAASALQDGGGPVRLAEVEFEAPLRLVADAPVRLQLVLRPEEGGVRSFTIASTALNERRPTWIRHVRGLVAHTDDEPGAAGERLAALRDRCVEAVDMAGVHAGLAALGIDYGPAFRRLTEGRRSAAAALGRLAELPASGHLLHPALLDAAFQTAALPGDAPAGRAFVPAGVGRLRFTGLRTAPAWAACSLRAVDGDAVTLDLRLWDEREQLVLGIEGFRLAPLAGLSPLDGSLFETRWLPRSAARELPTRGSWLILSDESGVGAALSGLLGPAPHVVARRGDSFAAEAPGRYRLDPLNPEHLARLLEEAFPEGPPERVVQLSALDAPAIDSAEAATRVARLCCLTTLHLVRALAERPGGRAPRLFLVVRGAQAAVDSTEVTHPQQALGWGFGLAVAQEYPELAATLIDLPTDGGLDALWTQLRHADDERLVALRGTGRLVPRLVRTRPDDAGRGDIGPDGTYLITGGLGGLGRVVAECLVRRGARRLALLSRGAPAPEAARWLEALRGRGVTVCHARADVADRQGLTAALDGLRRELGPVTSIVHTAGVLDDATLPNLTDERVERVLAPKVLGTALLTELVPEAERLVLFSSAAGLLGSAGQSAYCAANAFLDAWAHHLARADRSALSLDWGAWTGVGLVAESDTRAASVGRSGLIGFSPQEGGELFERLLPTARRQLAPLALDWAALASDPDVARSRPLLSDLATALDAAPAAAAGADGLVERVLTATTARERTDRLEAYVRARVGEVAGLGVMDAAPTTALKELGLDSLMIVRLRNAFTRDLGVELPTSAVFSAADIRGLARDLGSALAERDTAQDATTGPGSALPAAEAEVPEADVRPATRDVVRLLRSARQDTPSGAHAIGLAVRLTVPTTRRRLTDILNRLAGRHAALRTAILTGTGTGEGPRLRVEREPAGPLLRWSELGGGEDEDGEVAGRLRELLEPPFDLAAAPLWRFELLDRGDRGQILVFGAHHAVSDLQSLLLVAAEIDRELSGAALGDTPLGDTVSNRDIDLLLQAQDTQRARPDDQPDSAAADWREAFTGSARLDLTLTRPRPPVRSFRAGSVTIPVPDRLMERVSSRASRLAITPAAFCLGTLTVLLARERERDRFVLAVPVDTRIHVDAYDAVGFFGVPVPIPAQAAPGEAIEDVLRRADGRLDRVLAKGAMFSDALSALAAQGLHRENAPLVEVYFNYVRSSAARLDHLEVLPAGTGYSDLDLMVTMTPDSGRLRLDYNLDIMDEADCTALGEAFLRLLAEAADDPATPARPPAPTRPAATARPAAPAPARPATPRHSLALAATFALGNLPLLCETALNDANDTASNGGGGGVTVAEAPYHHVLASLRDPSGVFADPSTVLGVVLLRATDLERFGPVSDALLAELRTAYPAALRALSERTRTPLVVGFLPSSYGDDRLERWEREVAAELAEVPGAAVLRHDDWTRHHAVADRFDDHTDKLAHLPFTPPFQAAVALTLAEVVRAVRRTPPKVIAVDGDETLWSGVAGEIGPDRVDLGGPRALLARRLLQWRAAGALLVLVSNNDEATVRAVLDRPDSLLRAEHFSVVSATWGRKAERLEAAARTLNLGLDSFVFLDDNPVEIAAMRSALPEVLSVTCPAAGELAPFLARLWPLVPAAATAEDSLRAEFYRQERARDAVRERAGFEEFLAQLDLEVDIRPLSEPDVQRAEQLVRRTNQFTLRARSADGGDLERWRRQGEVWTAAARDRFGDYGQIGLLAVRQDGDRLDVLAWMLSCRALGRGVEERLLGWLADRADALGCATVRLTAERTPRNVPARRLLAALGGGEPDDTRLTLVTTPEGLRAFRSWEQ
ncbi:modular polyketide synthase [Streptomyces bingchenggensis BCW-1]|uniref:Modular polyketide synthase n=3 Tax=Streptomyces TaxID=1883 RepID=D7C3U7_STRBB|nr:MULTISPECIES: type I polyketide synthase [Streptomyces]ADI12313.1 modular polyketide synthase [Streptomyces bingchenggensis BCW-1]